MNTRIQAVLEHETFWRFVKFVIIGIINTAFAYLVYAALVLAGLEPQPALALSYVIGVTWNYFTHARFVFDTQGFTRLPGYVLAYLLLYFLNVWALEALTGAGLSPLIAQAVIVPFAAVLSFVLLSRVLTGKFPLIGRP